MINKIALNMDQNEKIVKPKKKFTFKTVLLGILILVILISGGYLFKVFAFTNAIGIKITPQDVLNPIKKDPELKKTTDGKFTNVLIVGIDSRSEKSQLKNTDTMIVASYSHETGDVTMISVPRDFYVPVPNEGWATKINGIYAHGENLKKGNGMNYLKGVLENLTGLNIQYYAMIDLQGFKKIIDAVGGVTVNVENTFTDPCYPADASVPRSSRHFCGLLPGMAETITFNKGPQKMNGTVALKYARSRHSSDFNEGTDFARGRRQQNVITALKEKLLSTDTLLNPKKVLEILDAIQENVKLSEFSTEDIQAAVNIGLKLKDKKTESYSFVLDPSVGNKALVKVGGFNAGNLYVIGPKAGLGNYTQIKEFVSFAFKNPKLYDENATVYVYDTGMGSALASAKTKELQKKYPYLNIVYMGTLFKDKIGTVVYPHESSKYNGSVAVYGKELGSTSITKPDYVKTNLNGENITILLGKAATTETTN